MVCRTEIANNSIYDYCTDDLPPMADRFRAVMRGRFVDELTGLGVTAAMAVTSTVDYLHPRVATNGIAGLAANPYRRFPQLENNTMPVHMRVEAARYISREFIEDLGPFNTGIGSPADYPNFFAPIELGDIGMHRAPTLIKGRCAQINGANRTGLDTVTVAITGLWHTFPAADQDPALFMEAPNIISLRQTLYRECVAGIDLLRARVLTPNLGDEKQLLEATRVGAQQIRVSDQVNTVVNDVIAIDSNNSDLVEFIRIAQIDGASTVNQPATLTLAYPLKKEHREGVTAIVVQPQAASANNHFTRDAYVGDKTLFLDGLVDLSSNVTIEITDGLAEPEYHAISLYSVNSDPNGFYRLPPLSRVAQAEITASRADLPDPVVTIFSPNYDLVENRLDLIF